MLSRVLSEDLWRANVLDPQGGTIRWWNNVFLVACFVSLFVDPLFFYLPIVREEQCIEIDIPLEVTLLLIRSAADIFYIIHMFIRARTAYVSPPSRVLGRGELVVDSSKIRTRYLNGGFRLDLLAALPLPQIVISVAMPLMRGTTTNSKNMILCIMIAQYLLRLFLVCPLWLQIVQATSAISQTAWAGAAYNLMLYMVASHVLGGCWYLLSIDAVQTCWRSVCDSTSSPCSECFFDCRKVHYPNRDSWFRTSNVSSFCTPASNFYDFGIYGDAFTKDVTGSPFINKYFYGYWWGLWSLSCLGQNLLTSTNIGENCFSILVAALGLVIFASLVANVQTYLQSLTIRLERWRLARADIEQWMHHRNLPRKLRDAIRKHHHFKWAATKGVDEESILESLPVGLRRVIKRHLCLNLVRRVSPFDQMNESTLDAICDRLKPVIYPKGTCLVREDDVVNEMIFIIRGHLHSYTTNGGSTGFLNSCQLGPGDFCGEEVLTCALSPRQRAAVVPSSTRTVRAISDVEAFALSAEDLRFVASQFRELRGMHLQGKFRFYSQQWRTWAAYSIQVAWRRYKYRKLACSLGAGETMLADQPDPDSYMLPPKPEVEE